MGPYYDTASFHNHRMHGSDSLLTDLRDPRLPDHIGREDRLTLPSLICLAVIMFAGLLLSDNKTTTSSDVPSVVSAERMVQKG